MPSRGIVWAVLLGLIAYDVPCAYLGYTTISEAVRQIDRDVNGLIRWGLLALWCHWFIATWFVP